jgi:ribosomal protein S18 acetylase RimI-like enzyme
VEKSKKKKQIRHLWEAVFDDSDRFIQLYFKQVYRDENALVVEKDGSIVSALQILPYTMTFCGKEITVAYISGACTLPTEQGKGWMSELLHQAFDEMKKRKIALSVLIPAEKSLFNYYRSYGYTETFEYSLKIYTRNEYFIPSPDRIYVQRRRKADEAIYAYFQRKTGERPIAIQHTLEDFRIILKDLKTAGGEFFVAYNSCDQPVGMAFASSPDIKANAEESSVLIKEILYDSEQVKTRLLYEITKLYDLLKAVYRIPYNNSFITYPYGMAKIIDAELLIHLWIEAHPESALSADKLRAMNIHELTRLLFAYSDRLAYMSLMLD